ncbi:MAG: helix-turn-helix domain-containing protein [Pseudolabrys sp.]
MGLDAAGEHLGALTWTSRKVASRQHIFHQGDPQRYVYLVKSGFVRLYTLLSNGRCQIIGFKSADDYVALQYYPEHRFSAQAISTVELQCVPVAEFYAAASRDPQFMLKLFNVVGEDLFRAHDLVLTIAKRDAEGSLASFLLAIADRAAPNSKTEFVALPMRRGDIADYLGLTNETVSRIFTIFKKRGFIEVRGRHGIRLINRNGLRAVTDRTVGLRKNSELDRPELAGPAV